MNVTSYLKTRNGSFVPIEAASEIPQNDQHIEGAIELEIDGVYLLDKDLWDDVDQLWSYLSDALVSLK